MRKAFIETLCSLAEKDDRIWLLCGDLGYSVLERFAQRFPDRYVNVGVAEQNMTGIAAGLAMTGKTVFTYSIANFSTLRCLEQIRNDVCYHNVPVKVIAGGGGFSYGAQGYTHHGLEDLAIMGSFPSMTILQPADPIETRLATRFITEYSGPCYLRLGRSGESTIHERELQLVLGKPIVVREGRDALIISSGSLLGNALKAGSLAERTGISVAVWSMPFVKPIDREVIARAAGKFRVIITAEEARTSGGIGSAVAEILGEMKGPRAILYRAGVPDTTLELSYEQETAREKVGLDAESLFKRIVEIDR